MAVWVLAGSEANVPACEAASNLAARSLADLFLTTRSMASTSEPVNGASLGNAKILVRPARVVKKKFLFCSKRLAAGIGAR